MPEFLTLPLTCMTFSKSLHLRNPHFLFCEMEVARPVSLWASITPDQCWQAVGPTDHLTGFSETPLATATSCPQAWVDVQSGCLAL